MANGTNGKSASLDSGLGVSAPRNPPDPRALERMIGYAQRLAADAEKAAIAMRARNRRILMRTLAMRARQAAVKLLAAACRSADRSTDRRS